MNPILKAERRRSKYRAVKTTVDGVTFASKKEAQRYGELKLLEQAGEIIHLSMQPVFVLRSPGWRDYRCTEDLGKYVADFQYEQNVNGVWSLVIEDVKGFRTPLYRWKKKHVEAQYGITIREI